MREWTTWSCAALILATGLIACAAEPASRSVVVERVLDGDTFEARDGDHVVRIRLIGIDTPELHSSAKLDAQLRRGWDRATIRRLAEESAAATRRLLRVGRSVRLELDVETHDRYGRLLAYAWAGDLLVNAELLREGHAVRLTIPPNVRYATWFGRLESAARDARRGLWTSWPPVRRAPGPPAARSGPAAAGRQPRSAGYPSSSRAALRSTRPSARSRTSRGTGPACVRRARSTASHRAV